MARYKPEGKLSHKRILVDMENNEDINMGKELTKLSWVTIKVIEVAI